MQATQTKRDLPASPQNRPSSDIFSAAFLQADVAAIARAIKADGFFSMENALSGAWLDALKADVAAHPFAVNKNWATGVYAEAQYYLTHLLACSRAFYRLVTHSRVFDVCDGILGKDYRLKAMRYYETYGSHRMQWHTDNKTDRGFAHIPGLIFIAYIEDVTDGEFQYVRGSHNWSGEKSYSDYSDEFIEQNHKAEIVSFKAPKGTLIIYDTYGIHRAKPVMKSGFVRKSLFFQVDSKLDSAEPILLNPSFMPPEDFANPKLTAYFGFGQPAEYAVYPETSLKQLPLHRLSAREIGAWLAYRILRTAYNIAPGSVRNAIRRAAGKPEL